MDGSGADLTVVQDAVGTIGQYVVGELGSGFETLLVITLSPDLWCPEENKEEDAEIAGLCVISTRP